MCAASGTIGAMREAHRIRVEGDRLRFAAAHMATFRGGCEPLHGHNYRVTVEVEGDLAEDAWVLDFGELKQLTSAVIGQLDHRFILQRASTALEIIECAERWEVRFGEATYVFPRSDVAALPIDNTTAERLAEWVAGQLLEALRSRGATNVRNLSIGIEEMPGQSGWYTVG